MPSTAGRVDTGPMPSIPRMGRHQPVRPRMRTAARPTWVRSRIRPRSNSAQAAWKGRIPGLRPRRSRRRRCPRSTANRCCSRFQAAQQRRGYQTHPGESEVSPGRSGVSRERFLSQHRGFAGILRRCQGTRRRSSKCDVALGNVQCCYDTMGLHCPGIGNLPTAWGCGELVDLSHNTPGNLNRLFCVTYP